MSIPESHLAQEAIAALVDGELTAGPANRAARHLAGCLQCRMAVQAQREAKEALHESADVAVPGDLMSRLCAIPFTTDVPGSGGGGTLSRRPRRAHRLRCLRLVVGRPAPRGAAQHRPALGPLAAPRPGRHARRSRRGRHRARAQPPAR